LRPDYLEVSRSSRALAKYLLAMQRPGSGQLVGLSGMGKSQGVAKIVGSDEQKSWRWMSS
jgi:putative ribosome biogenesis GTPase RsgA